MTLIWIHGVNGSTAANLFLEDPRQSRCFDLPEGCKVILPKAPIRKFPELNDRKMPNWFNTRIFTITKRESEISEEFFCAKYD